MFAFSNPIRLFSIKPIRKFTWSTGYARFWCGSVGTNRKTRFGWMFIDRLADKSPMKTQNESVWTRMFRLFSGTIGLWMGVL